MKKIILLVALLVPFLLLAQEENVKKAYKLVKKVSPDFAEAESLVNEAVKSEGSKQQSNTWFTKGFIEYRKYEVEDDKRFEVPPGKPDVDIQSEASYKAYSSWIIADSLDLLESVNDPKRKGKMEYRKDIVSNLNKMPLYINNYGNILFKKNDFAGAKQVFEKFALMPTLDMFNGSDIIKASDTIFMDAYQNIQVCLRQLYVQQKNANDTTAFVASLNEGTERFPDNTFFLTEKIQYYINMKLEKEAIDNINKAIALDPENHIFYFIRGLINSFKVDMKAEAEKDFLKAIELKPDYAEAIFAYGNLIYDKADAAYNRATIDIRNPKQAAVEMQYAKDTYNQAIPYFEKARALNITRVKDDLLLKLQSAYYKLGNTEKVKEIRAERGL